MAESINGRQVEAPENEMNIRQILKGDDPRIMAFLKRQIPFIMLVIGMVLFYIANRYDSQCDLVRIEKLKKELTDVRYQALNITSDVSAKSKPSYIEKAVGSGNYGLQSAEQAPFILKTGNRRR
ncbi:MAG: hypothetical protein MJY65_04320 [Bacteroidaceae bacterium]|nr:hypothetical protein [Bacteroidaceae bacterium]